jgi:hypothetical protein
MLSDEPQYDPPEILDRAARALFDYEQNVLYAIDRDVMFDDLSYWSKMHRCNEAFVVLQSLDPAKAAETGYRITVR